MLRQRAIEKWLGSLFPGQAIALTAASADASFRRYFRLTLADGSTRIVMDAPPAHEDCRPWLRLRKLFHDAGAAVPDVIAENLEQGFLLLSDLGTTTYLEALHKLLSDTGTTTHLEGLPSATPQRAHHLYLAALDTLVDIQRASQPGVLPLYDHALLKREIDLFPEWYVTRHLGVTLTEAQSNQLGEVFEKIIAVNLAEPTVYVHRDYHSRNLMLPADGNKPGVIDFQDAVYGPISYDLVSLLKDAYIEWEEEQTLDWLIRYWEKARKAGIPIKADFAGFHRDYEWMGVQRHLKVLGIFARLGHRDGKDGYLKNMPLVAKYLRAACTRYDELTPLRKLLDQLEDKITVLGQTMPAKR